MADKEDGATTCRYLTYFTEALFLKVRISYGKYLIHNHNFWLQMGRDGKGQSHVHSAAVAFHRSVEKLFNRRERDDLIKLGLDLGTAHTKDRTIQKDVFASRQFSVKPGPYLKQTSHATLDS